jgi:glycerol kinase
MRHVVAIDQGTTGSTVLILDEELRVRGRGYQEYRQIYPQPGWVEHDPEDIWGSVTAPLGKALATRAWPASIAAIGITNQRETSMLWERASGKALHNAIVWQDRRTADRCAQLKAAGREARVRAADRPHARPVLLGHQARVAARSRVGAARRAPSPRRAGVRHHRHLPGVAAHRRRGPRHRRHQRLAHAAARSQHAGLVRRAADALLGVPTRAAADRVVNSSGVLGTTRGVPGLPDGLPIAAWPATSRPRCSARPASRRARPSAPTAPAPSS